jgi:uncharacterized membrane protein YqjE
MANLQGTADSASPKLLDSLKLYVSGWIALLKTRLEILSNEIEEERERLRQVLLLGVACAFFTTLGVLLLTFLVIALFWEQRLAVLGAFTVVYLAAGVAAGIVMRKKAKIRPKLFSASLAELRKDERQLTPTAHR